MIKIPPKIQGYRGIVEKNFFDPLDKMSIEEFGNQCTWANPRYFTISDMKQIYIDFYYGNHIKSFLNSI